MDWHLPSNVEGEGRVGEVEGREGNADEAECRNRQVASLSSGWCRQGLSLMFTWSRWLARTHQGNRRWLTVPK